MQIQGRDDHDWRGGMRDGLHKRPVVHVRTARMDAVYSTGDCAVESKIAC